MPTYTYRCQNCENVFDEVSKIKDMKDPKQCDLCGAWTSNVIITKGPLIGDPIRMGVTKVSDAFNETLRGIRDQHVGSTIELRK